MKIKKLTLKLPFLVIPIVCSFEACIPFHSNTSIQIKQVNSPKESDLNEKLAKFRAKQLEEIQKMKEQIEQEFNSAEGNDNPLLDTQVP